MGGYIAFLLCNGISPAPSPAQIVPDSTAASQVETTDSMNFSISGGTAVGMNLLHSLDQFSLPSGGSVQFHNPLNRQNIITRVTGGVPSQIEGQINVLGPGNLFLINPAGISFGQNAALNLNGSFIASTASTINFTDDNAWQLEDSSPPTLSLSSMPMGLQFSAQANGITVNSNLQGLQVNPGKTLGLVGGNVTIDGGILVAPGGQVLIGSVGENSLVNLQVNSSGINFNYGNVERFNFQDIQLINNAGILTNQLPGSFIQIRGQNLELLNQSALFTLGGNIDIDIVKVVNLDSSIIRAEANGENASVITIKAGTILQDNLSIITINDFGLNPLPLNNAESQITIQAAQSIELKGASQITSQTFGLQDAGNIEIITEEFILRDGGQITSTTFSFGDSGDINITANKVIEIQGTELQEESDNRLLFESGVFARTSGRFDGPLVTGAAGNIKIQTSQLTLTDSARIAVAAEEASRGPAGNVTIETVESILLDNQAQISASTATGTGGNINLRTQDFRLLDNSQIITNAQGEATGGNITINTKILSLFGNSDISANAEQGFGGRVTINTQGLLRSADGAITATSQRGPEFDGVVNINVELDPSQGVLNLPQEGINVPVFQGCYGARSGGNSFLVTGQGGTAASPQEFRPYDDIWQDRRTVADVRLPGGDPDPTPGSGEVFPIMEARGWRLNAYGDVVLVAQAPTLKFEQNFAQIFGQEFELINLERGSEPGLRTMGGGTNVCYSF